MYYNICVIPEVNVLKLSKPIVISSEFPSWQNDRGESKGAILLFKLAKMKNCKTTPTKLKVNRMIYTERDFLVSISLVHISQDN